MTMAVTVAARATAAAIAAARAMATAVAYDESCCGDGGMSALSVLPLLQTNTMKYQLLSQSHPHLKMFFLFFGEHTSCDGKGFLSNQLILIFC
jgi:hypothetical protein